MTQIKAKLPLIGDYYGNPSKRFRFKGKVPTFTDLPNTNGRVFNGNTYYVIDEDETYFFDEGEFKKVEIIIDGDGGTSFKDLGYQPFSATETYAKDDIVIYNKKLYKFTADHSAGAWVGTDAEETSINQEIAYEHAGRVAGDALKINEPSQEGTSGQVLTTDGNGGRSWATQGAVKYDEEQNLTAMQKHTAQINIGAIGQPEYAGNPGDVLTLNSAGAPSWETPGGGLPPWGEYGELLTVSLSIRQSSTEQAVPMPSALHPLVQIVDADDETSVIMQKEWYGTAMTFNIGKELHYKVKFGGLDGYIAPATSIEYTAVQYATNSVQATYVNARVQQLGVMIMRDDKQFFFADEWDTAWNTRAVGVAIADIQHNILVAPMDIGSFTLAGSYSILIDPDTGEEYTNKCALLYDWESAKNTDVYIYNHDRTYWDDPTTIPVRGPGMARAYVWKDDPDVRGDLPASGAANFMIANMTALNNALTLIAGTPFDETKHWLSNYRDGTSGVIFTSTGVSITGGLYVTAVKMCRPIRNLPNIIL